MFCSIDTYLSLIIYFFILLLSMNCEFFNSRSNIAFSSIFIGYSSTNSGCFINKWSNDLRYAIYLFLIFIRLIISNVTSSNKYCLGVLFQPIDIIAIQLVSNLIMSYFRLFLQVSTQKKAFKWYQSSMRIICFSIIVIPILTFLFGQINGAIYHGSIQRRISNNSPTSQLLCLKEYQLYICSGFGCESETKVQGWSYYRMNINVSGCFFSRSSQLTGYGGVIYVDSGSYTMNILLSMFYNCLCSKDGGAIYFVSSSSYLRMLCAHRCSCGASRSYNFAYISSSQMNQVEYLSVSCCSHSLTGRYTINLWTGNQRADNTNCSMNNVVQDSGIGFSAPSSFTSSYCTFSNNMASNSICIRFYSTSGTISLSYANIVHNNSPSNYGVVFANGAVQKKIIHCIFQNNHNYLICLFEGSLEVFHSYIDHSSLLFTGYLEVLTTNNSFTNRMTYQIQFFKSLHCNADVLITESIPLNTLHNSPMRSNGETINRTNQGSLRITLERTIFFTTILYLSI